MQGGVASAFLPHATLLLAHSTSARVRSGPARTGLLEFEHRYSGGAVNRPSRLRWWRGASIARSILAGSVFMSAGFLMTRRFLCQETQPCRSDVSDRLRTRCCLPATKDRRSAPSQHDRMAQHKFSSTLLRYPCDAELCQPRHFLDGDFDQSYRYDN